MEIRNSEKSTVLSDKCLVADRFITRFKGLLGKRGLDSGSGLLIIPCNSIHMFFMKFPIDVVFLDRENTVVHLVEGIKPWRLSRIVRKAHSVLELPVGVVGASMTEVGDKLDIRK